MEWNGEENGGGKGKKKFKKKKNEWKQNLENEYNL